MTRYGVGASRVQFHVGQRWNLLPFAKNFDVMTRTWPMHRCILPEEVWQFDHGAWIGTYLRPRTSGETCFGRSSTIVDHNRLVKEYCVSSGFGGRACCFGGLISAHWVFSLYTCLAGFRIGCLRLEASLAGSYSRKVGPVCTVWAVILRTVAKNLHIALYQLFTYSRPTQPTTSQVESIQWPKQIRSESIPMEFSVCVSVRCVSVIKRIEPHCFDTICAIFKQIFVLKDIVHFHKIICLFIFLGFSAFPWYAYYVHC